MTKITAHYEVPNQHSDHWASRGIIITAVSQVELESFASLVLTHQHLGLIMRTLRTLAEALETKGANPADILKTIVMLLDPTKQAKEQIAYLVRILEHSVHLPPPTEMKGTLQ